MIFIMKPDGTIMPSIPSPVYQGADGTNVIYLFAPSMVGNQATIAFKTPDGVWTERDFMTQITQFPEELSKYRYCVWQYTIGAPIARLDGVVTVQFFFYANGAILPSSASSFVVGRGVPVVLPEAPEKDVYDKILQAISEINKSLQYGDYAARAIFAWRKDRVDGAAIVYGKGEFTYVPAGEKGGPNGKTGSFVRSIVNENIQPPYVDGKLNSAYWEEIVNFDYLNELYFSDLKELAEQAEGYKDAAEVAQQGALAAKENAELAEQMALQSALAAEESRRASDSSAAAAEESRRASESSAAAAKTYEEGAEVAKNFAVKAQEAAELAAGQAAGDVVEQLRDLTDEAQEAAKNAQGAAQEAKAAEQGAIDAKNAANVVLADTTREKEAAEAAQRGALAAKEAAETAQQGSLNAKEAAEAAHQGALSARDEAEGYKDAAETAHQGALSARDEAQGAAQEAKAAAGEAAEKAANAVVEELQELKNAAETAQKNAEKSAQNAETAKAGAEAARDRAVQAQEAVESAESAINTRLDAIEEKIPDGASATNKLATESFVNSTVQTATANFRGNWKTWTAVPTSADEYPEDYVGSRTPTVNDYIVVQDASGYSAKELSGTWRFKYSGVWDTNGKNGWQPEYQVNETPLTDAQLEALNSGISKESLEQIEKNRKAIAAETERAKAAEEKNAAAAEEAKSAAGAAQKAAETAQETADAAIPKTEKGVKNGVATLDGGGKVPSEQLPNALPPSGTAGGDLTGSYPNPTIANGAVTKEKCSDDVKASLMRADEAVPSNTKGEAGGVASLGADGKVPAEQLPASATGDYIPNDEKGKKGGVATLDDNGKVPSGQLPASLPPSGKAGGDLDGSYPNPTVKTGAITREKCESGVQDSLNMADSSVQTSGGKMTGDLEAPNVAVEHQVILPPANTGGKGCGIYETKDQTNLFGFLASDTDHETLNVGSPSKNLAFHGKSARPTYNGKDMPLSSEIPTVPSTLPPSGTAGGDLTGSYPNPTIANGAVTKEKCSDDVKASLMRADEAVPSNTKGEAGGVASLGADGKVLAEQLPSVAVQDVSTYDLIIRNQADFEAWYMTLKSNAVIFHSVLICHGTYTKTDGEGIKLPDTLYQLHGLGNVQINITFSYNSSNPGGIFYSQRPSGGEYSIRNINVALIGTGGRSPAFYNCTNLTNCTGNASGPSQGGVGFRLCSYLTNCRGYGSAADTGGDGYGFLYCDHLMDCMGSGTCKMNNYAYGFYHCDYLVNCYGAAIAPDNTTGTAYAFEQCNYLTNCKADPLTGRIRYCFHSCNYCCSCTLDSTTLYTPTAVFYSCKNVDWQTCPEYVDHEYHIFYDSTNPATLYGGTWEELPQGTFLEAAGSSGTAGVNHDAGLPNIKGNFSIVRTTDQTSISDGDGKLFVKTSAGSSADLTSHPSVASFSGQQPDLITLDASKLSGIYKNGVTTVQPKSTTTHIWKRKVS